MPFFATGNQYSPTGDWLEGQQSSAYAASLGLSSIVIPIQAN